MQDQLPDSAYLSGNNHNQSCTIEEVLSAHPNLDRRVRLVLQIIHFDITQTHQVKDLAKKAGISPDYLARLFRTEMRQGIIEYIQEVRLQKACDLLVTSFLSVTEIALQVGFHSMSYFDEVFHAHYDLTPSGYRKQFDNGAGQEKSF